MDYLSHNISINLRRIRQSKSMSLERAAEQTGVSKSMLAQIEKGTANPSLGVLGKITSGLRIEFQRLIETPKEDFCLVKPEALVPTKEIEDRHFGVFLIQAAHTPAELLRPAVRAVRLAIRIGEQIQAVVRQRVD